MKYMYVLILLVWAVAIALGSTACDPGACAAVQCLAVTNETCPNGVIGNSGPCGCCPACLKKIPKDQDCSLLIVKQRNNPDPASACETGTSCQRCRGSWICKK